MVAHTHMLCMSHSKRASIDKLQYSPEQCILQAAKAKQKALLNEEAGIASLKAVLSGAPVNGKDFSDMDDDDEQVQRPFKICLA